MSGGRGAGDRPLTYAGEYEVARTYLPREVVKTGGGVFMALSKHDGIAPPDPAHWLVLGGPVLDATTLLADGPPTDGSVFWYVTDESC